MGKKRKRGQEAPTYFGQDDFWSQVLGGSTERPGTTLHLLCESKVSDFDVTLLVNQKILRLQVPEPKKKLYPQLCEC